MSDYKSDGNNRERNAGASAPEGTDLGETPAKFGTGIAGPMPSGGDLYLSPHADDICFSLGELVRNRRAGTLLTVFSRSGYLAQPAAQAANSPDQISAIRSAEDAAFAAGCNLALEPLGLPDARLRGLDSFSLDALASEAEALEPVLLDRLRDLAVRRDGTDRPWMFCPSGIGGHLDHVAIMTVVARNLENLQKIHRVCFYEDLHYASNVLARSVGLRRLAQTLSRFTLLRRDWPLAQSGSAKLDLLRLYPSQFAVLPTSIDRFTPAIYAGGTPHEAVWVPQRRR